MTRDVAVGCPNCDAEVQWSEANPWRPFCSARCRAIDLGEWATNRYVIAGSDVTDRSGEAGRPATEPGQ
jgi:endogenous inhibitor of DNA gyrase (YacG/DUF329 family)